MGGAGTFIQGAGNALGDVADMIYGQAAQDKLADLLKREEGAVPDVTARQLQIEAAQAANQPDVGFGQTR